MFSLICSTREKGKKESKFISQNNFWHFANYHIILDAYSDDDPGNRQHLDLLDHRLQQTYF